MTIDFAGWWRVLTTPSCWIQLHPYSEAWDTKLRALLADHEFTHVEKHTARLGNVDLWVSNRPYACMYPHHTSRSYSPLTYSPHPTIEVRASRVLTLYACDRLERAALGTLDHDSQIQALP